jgi:hypothetical protein
MNILKDVISGVDDKYKMINVIFDNRLPYTIKYFISAELAEKVKKYLETPWDVSDVFWIVIDDLIHIQGNYGVNNKGTFRVNAYLEGDLFTRWMSS